MKVDGEVKGSPIIFSLGSANDVEAESIEYAAVGSYDGFLYIVNTGTGQVEGAAQCGGSIFASPVLLNAANTSRSSAHLCVATTSGEMLFLTVESSGSGSGSGVGPGPRVEDNWQWSSAVTVTVTKRFSMNSPLFSTPLIYSGRDDEDETIGKEKVKGKEDEQGWLICCGVDGNLHVMSEDGQRLWTSSITTASVFSTPALYPPAPALKSAADSPRSPRLHSDSNSDSGDEIAGRRKQAPSFVVGAHDGKVRRIDFDGSILWETDVGAAVFGAPFCISHAEGGEWVAASTTAGRVVLLRGGDGGLAASIELQGEIFSSVLVCSNKIYVGCRDDRIYCLEYVQTSG